MVSKKFKNNYDSKSFSIITGVLHNSAPSTVIASFRIVGFFKGTIANTSPSTRHSYNFLSLYYPVWSSCTCTSLFMPLLCLAFLKTTLQKLLNKFSTLQKQVVLAQVESLTSLQSSNTPLLSPLLNCCTGLLWGLEGDKSKSVPHWSGGINKTLVCWDSLLHFEKLNAFHPGYYCSSLLIPIKMIDCV